MHDVRVDHHAAVVAAHILLDLGAAGIGIEFDVNNVRLEGVTRIHVHFTIGVGQATARGHLPHEFRLQARLHARRHLVKLAVRDGGDLVPRQAFVGLAAHGYITVFVDGGFDAAIEIVCGDFEHGVAYLSSRTRRSTAEHDRHATADGAVRWQRAQ